MSADGEMEGSKTPRRGRTEVINTDIKSHRLLVAGDCRRDEVLEGVLVQVLAVGHELHSGPRAPVRLGPDTTGGPKDRNTGERGAGAV